MNLNIKNLCVIMLLCTTMFTVLLAQEDEVTSAMLLITYDNPNDSNKREQINLSGEEAYQFDVASFLTKNKYHDIQVNGGGTINNEKLTWHFRSKSLELPLECTKFCQVISSVEKTPFFGVGVVALDDFTGVRITKIIEESSAEKYGFQVGDIITLIDDYEIYTPCDLTKAINKSKAGHVIEVDIIRDETNQLLEPVLGYRLYKKLTWKPCCDQQPVVLPEVATKNNWNADLFVFPNPTEGIAQVEYVASEKGLIEMTITDLTGRIIFTKNVNEFDGFFNDVIDLTNQPDGIYFLNIIQGEKVKTEKIVLQKL